MKKRTFTEDEMMQNRFVKVDSYKKWSNMIEIGVCNAGTEEEQKVWWDCETGEVLINPHPSTQKYFHIEPNESQYIECCKWVGLICKAASRIDAEILAEEELQTMDLTV